MVLSFSLLMFLTVPRTREGYYHYTGGIEVAIEVRDETEGELRWMQAAIKRTMTFAPYADLLWLETKSPDLAQARYFARRIREKFPGKYVTFWSSSEWQIDYKMPGGSFIILAPVSIGHNTGFLGSFLHYERAVCLSKYSETDLKNFIWELAQEGYVCVSF